MRLKHSFKNITIGILTQVSITLLGFISRRVFLNSLGTEYMGLNGLLTNVLSMLSLVEGGIGVSIVYSLYKPLAENNKEKIIALVQLYKKLYEIIAVVVAILSVIIYPMIDIVIAETDTIKYIPIVYGIFVAKNIISYLNAHKWSLINADQKGYVIAKYNLFFNILTTIIRIIVLKLTSNYILYLILELLVIIIQNIWNGAIVDKYYPYIKTKYKYAIDTVEKKLMLKNVRAIALHNIGAYCVFGTDNLLISFFVNLKTVGLYSNYTMVINQLLGILKPIINGISDSIGNLIVTESKEKTYEVFKLINLINFWIYGFTTIFLYNLLEPFITWFLGDGLLLNKFTFNVILINYYINGMRDSISLFKSKAGIFSNDRYYPLLEAIINLGCSIILVKYFGLAGIFLGTTISTILIPLWIPAKLVYNIVFERNAIEYFKQYLFFFLIMIMGGVMGTLCCDLVTIPNQFISLVLKGIIIVIVVNCSFIVCLFKTSEFTALARLLKKTLMHKFKNKS